MRSRSGGQLLTLLREVELLERRETGAARWLADPLAFYRAGGSAFVPDGESPCHDLVALMAAVHPHLVRGPVLPVAVQTGPGPAWGMTVADRRGLVRSIVPNDLADQPTPAGYADVRVGLEVDCAFFRKELRRMFSA